MPRLDIWRWTLRNPFHEKVDIADSSRAMNRESGRLITLLQEERERLSSESQLADDAAETDEALPSVNLDTQDSERHPLKGLPEQPG